MVKLNLPCEQRLHFRCVSSRAKSSYLLILGTLRNYDGDGNGNVRESNRFNEQNNNSARASRFFVNFFAVLAQL